MMLPWCICPIYMHNVIINISLRITISKKVQTVELHTFMKSDHTCEVLRGTSVTNKTSLDFICRMIRYHQSIMIKR